MRSLIDADSAQLSVRRQCELLGLSRSSLYYEALAETETNLCLMRLIDEQYMATPFYGSRRMAVWLTHEGHAVNRKRVQRLMQLMDLEAIYPKPRLSLANKEHRKFPYLLRGLSVNRVNQVWSTDITYVPMKKGFMYLCAVIDIHTRYVMGWGVSNSMTAEWCTDIVNDAIETHGKPEIINSDQGSQFTSEVYISLLKAREIQISMDGKGRAVDNIFIERLWRTVKYEHIYLNVYEDGLSLFRGLQQYFTFYNDERRHQSLNNETPLTLYGRAA